MVCIKVLKSSGLTQVRSEPVRDEIYHRRVQFRIEIEQSEQIRSNFELKLDNSYSDPIRSITRLRRGYR